MRIGFALRRVTNSWPRRLLLAGTALIGVLVAVAVVAFSPADQRSFVATSSAVQSLMSVTLPFIGVLLATDLRQPGDPGRVGPTLQAAAIVAVGIGGWGVLVSAAATALAGSTAPGGPWQSAGLIIVGSLVVQVIAMFVGTGCGLLLSPPYLAMLATIVAPLGIWLLLGLIPTLTPARDWVTPFAALQQLFTGELTALDWVQWAVVAAIWAVAPNLVGARRLAASRG